jgi:hypothetical protein
MSVSEVSGTCHNSANVIMARDVSSLPMFYQMPPAEVARWEPLRATLNGP